MDSARMIIDTNLFGAFHFTRAELPMMREQRSGRLVHISSILGILPAPFLSVYAASKHALEGWSESLDHNIVSGDDPLLVARAVHRVARAARPRLRYQVGKATRKRALLRRWVPEGMFDASFRKQFGLTE